MMNRAVNNTRMDLECCLFKYKSFDQFSPPVPPQILDTYLVVVLYALSKKSQMFHLKHKEGISFLVLVQFRV